MFRGKTNSGGLSGSPLLVCVGLWIIGVPIHSN